MKNTKKKFYSKNQNVHVSSINLKGKVSDTKNIVIVLFTFVSIHMEHLVLEAMNTDCATNLEFEQLESMVWSFH